MTSWPPLSARLTVSFRQRRTKQKRPGRQSGSVRKLSRIDASALHQRRDSWGRGEINWVNEGIGQKNVNILSCTFSQYNQICHDYFLYVLSLNIWRHESIQYSSTSQWYRKSRAQHDNEPPKSSTPRRVSGAIFRAKDQSVHCTTGDHKFRLISRPVVRRDRKEPLRSWFIR